MLSDVQSPAKGVRDVETRASRNLTLVSRLSITYRHFHEVIDALERC